MQIRELDFDELPFQIVEQLIPTHAYSRLVLPPRALSTDHGWTPRERTEVGKPSIEHAHWTCAKVNIGKQRKLERIHDPAQLNRGHWAGRAGGGCRIRLALVTACLNWAVGSPLAVLHRVGGFGKSEFEARLVDAGLSDRVGVPRLVPLVLSVEWATTGCLAGAVAAAVRSRGR